MRRLVIILTIVAGLVLPTAALADTKTDSGKVPTPKVVHMLPPVGDYPDAPCADPQQDAGNFYLGPTGDFWECICEVRVFVPEPDCAWYNQGPITGAESRSLKKKLRRATLPKGRVINTKLWKVMPV